MVEHALSVEPEPAGEAGRQRVAILMRTRDRPVLLARALASVLAQEHQDWRLVLVNDGGDPEPVEALVARHATGFGERIDVVHMPHSLGRQAAANRALRRASALPDGFDLLALHDDDDTWHPRFLSGAVRWLVEPGHAGFAAVLTHWQVVQERLDGDGVVEDRRETAPFTMPVLRFDSMLGCNRVPINALLFRRGAVEAAGTFEASMPVLEDWDWLLRVMAGGDIGVLPQPLASYHHRDAGTLPPYLNSVHEAASAHETGFIRYRNNQLRALVDRDPGALALLGTLGLQAERQHERAEQQQERILANLDRNGLWGHARHEDLQHRLIRVEAMLAEVQSSLSTLAQRPEPAPTTTRRPFWKQAARRLAGPLIDGLRRGSA